MPDFLKITGSTGSIHPAEIFVRLAVALVFGFAVAWVYRRTRSASEITASFPTTLVLLCILIAMVTQVIGDNVARAFSLVGALSIVRFRTVVRDTRDTAFVIFAVVLGMAVGANSLWVTIIGFVVVTSAAFLLVNRKASVLEAQPTYLLKLRVALGVDAEEIVRTVVGTNLSGIELVSVGTARQGVAVDYVYETRVLPGTSATELLRVLNKTEGVQNVELERRELRES